MTHPIFISYRRSDAAGYAFALWDRLRKEFGDLAVFYDRDEKHHMPSGCDWEKHIFAAIDGAGVCVVAIGPDWANAHDEAGKRRLDHPDDIVRKEVARALGRAEKSELILFPALFGKTEMPVKEALPEDLRGLHRWNARVYRMDADTEAAFERLVDEIAICPGMQRVLVTREHREVINTVKAIVAEGLLPKAEGNVLKMELLKELILTTVKNKGN